MSLFHDLAQLADHLSTEPSRLAKRAAIAAAIRNIVVPTPAEIIGDPHGEAFPPAAQDHALEDAGLFCLYLAGQPFPEADPRKLNAGGALLTRALKEASHCTDAALTAAYRRHGDLGAAAYDLLAEHRHEVHALKGTGFSPSINSSHEKGALAPEGTLTLDELANAFDTIAIARTTAARSAIVLDILRRATALEAKYLLKLMLGDMRIGVKQSLIEEAIAIAASTEANTIAPAAVRHAVMLEADLARAVTMSFAGTLANARMRLFHPLGFMLASPVETPEEAIARFTPKPPKPEKPAKKSRRKVDANEDSTPTTVISTEAPPSISVISTGAHTPISVISTGAQRSGETCSSSTDAEGFPPSAQDIQAYLEDKYDGMRAQLHCGDPNQPNRVALYSRNREDITHSFPELTEAFASITTPPGPLILDGEILGWDLATNKALPFAILGQRIGRKKIDDDLRRQIPVIFMAFDILFQDGDLLLNLPLRERRQRLEKLVAKLTPIITSPITTPKAQSLLFTSDSNPEPWALGPEPSRLHLSPATLVETAEAIDQAYTDARARANEGVMLKSAESTYTPGRRGLEWVKLKRELATLDVVITGAEYGHGKRAGLLSDYTFAVQGPRGANGQPAELLNVGKAYSGVTDAEILELTDWLKAHTLEDHGHFRTVEPLRILEVAFNNIMRSTRHASGFAMRFPRILRLRDDKPVSEIDTLARVEEIYQSQPDRPVEEQP